MGELTKYRRMIRRPNKDNENLPVIFNDYMNCLFGDPTTEKELPLIDAAAAMDCEYYVIDAAGMRPANGGTVLVNGSSAMSVFRTASRK